MRTASKIIAILLAISIIGGIQHYNSAPTGTMEFHTLALIIRLILVIIFAYFGWRPKKKKYINNQEIIDEDHRILEDYQQKETSNFVPIVSEHNNIKQKEINQNSQNDKKEASYGVKEIFAAILILISIILVFVIVSTYDEMLTSSKKIDTSIIKTEEKKKILSEYQEKIPKLIQENEDLKIQTSNQITQLKMENDRLADKIIKEDKTNCITRVYFTKGSLTIPMDLAGNIKINRSQYGEYIIEKSDKTTTVIDKGYFITAIYVSNIEK